MWLNHSKIYWVMLQFNFTYWCNWRLILWRVIFSGRIIATKKSELLLKCLCQYLSEIKHHFGDWWHIVVKKKHTLNYMKFHILHVKWNVSYLLSLPCMYSYLKYWKLQTGWYYIIIATIMYQHCNISFWYAMQINKILWNAKEFRWKL